MKLMTELVTEVPYERPFHHVEGPDDAMAHDAAVAHALVMAMSESARLDSDSIWEYERDRVFKRATEIMREWGYGED